MMITTHQAPAVDSFYKSGERDLQSEFFSPCLKQCVGYDRAVGFFRSSSLSSWVGKVAQRLPNVIPPFRIIASPQMNYADATTLNEIQSDSTRLEYLHKKLHEIIEEIISLSDGITTDAGYARFFAWLIVHGHLEIRFAFPKHVEEPGQYHQKMGVFHFNNGHVVAFTGSANETYSGHHSNFESIDVFRNWVEAEVERVEHKILQFEEEWSGSAAGLEVIPLSQQAIEKLQVISNNYEEGARDDKQPTPFPRVTLWDHQEKAVAEFLKVGSGILEMATGTGKTRTAIAILQELVRSERIDYAVITVESPDLLDQWAKEISHHFSNWVRMPLLYRHYRHHHEIGSFRFSSPVSVLLLSRSRLPELLRKLAREKAKRTLIVHDEVHSFGSPQLRNEIDSLQFEARHTLGLSATPDRAYDDEGNDFIRKNVGPVIYRYSLKDAIKNGVLAEFTYVPIAYQLTNNDKKRVGNVYKKKAARQKQGNPMTDEEVWIEIARVYKTAEKKIALFIEYLQTAGTVLQQCIIFVETKEFGNELLPSLHTEGIIYRTFYGEDDEHNLQEFSQGQIDCLVTCHRLSQGIDLPSLKNVVLFSSARSTLETTQRIGRCLRKDPNNTDKIATVVDFVLEVTQDDKDNSHLGDQYRKDWLTELSKTRRMNYGP